MKGVRIYIDEASEFDEVMGVLELLAFLQRCRSQWCELCGAPMFDKSRDYCTRHEDAWAAILEAA